VLQGYVLRINLNAATSQDPPAHTVRDDSVEPGLTLGSTVSWRELQFSLHFRPSTDSILIGEIVGKWGSQPRRHCSNPDLTPTRRCRVHPLEAVTSGSNQKVASPAPVMTDESLDVIKNIHDDGVRIFLINANRNYECGPLWFALLRI
jgi:hypothetical protein